MKSEKTKIIKPMQLINKNHPAIIEEGNKRKLTVTINERSFAFSKGVSNVARMGSAKYIHFFDTGTNWKFICNNDADGFSLGRDREAFRITNQALVKFFKAQTGYKSLPLTFIVTKTDKLYKGDLPILEIEVKNPQMFKSGVINKSVWEQTVQGLNKK